MFLLTIERVDYYLRSSVLGGKVITELDSQGQKRKTNVYVGNKVAAEQLLYGQTQSLVWKYQNPVTGTSAEQTSYGVTRKEYDPFGLELGQSDPYLQSEEPDYASMGGSFYRDGGNPFDGESGCQWNGMPIQCDSLFSFVLRTQNVVEWQLGRNVDRSFLSGLHWVEDEGKPLGPAGPGIDPDGVVRVNHDDNGLGHWELFHFFFDDLLARQEPRIIRIATLHHRQISSTMKVNLSVTCGCYFLISTLRRNLHNLNTIPPARELTRCLMILARDTTHMALKISDMASPGWWQPYRTSRQAGTKIIRTIP